jgi:hypothetical protein
VRFHLPTSLLVCNSVDVLEAVFGSSLVQIFSTSMALILLAKAKCIVTKLDRVVYHLEQAHDHDLLGWFQPHDGLNSPVDTMQLALCDHH